ncbi:MAG TPA: ABC transporter ATP-binding protein [Candidatus Paceibacterota bacterium]|nr:ABC transporter ATP-binding protein [Candidatus Paceibacterota bacterium]
MKETFLEAKNIEVHYGGVKALDNASISIDEGEIVALMGPNGAGKSTMLKALFGLAPIFHGSVLIHGQEISPEPVFMVKEKIAFVPQGRRVFKYLTVKENLMIGAYVERDKRIATERFKEVLEFFPMLKSKLKQKSGQLSGGQQQMVAIARGLMTDPKLLILDEPSLGLSPKITKEVFEKIKEINTEHKTAILVVEHNLKSLLPIVDRAYVLDKGKVVHTGSGQEIIESNILERVFLGRM